MSKKATFLPMNLSLAPFLIVLITLSCVVVVHGVHEKKVLSLHNNIWSSKKSNEASSSCFSHNLGMFFFSSNAHQPWRKSTVSYSLVQYIIA